MTETVQPVIKELTCKRTAKLQDQRNKEADGQML